ncbi:DUF460 domain-containing protein [Candidatus Micrarchaeota archaeon]|nr:DUF460 domain-containing protein [Candidatus Micrarchaeota archaeon]
MGVDPGIKVGYAALDLNGKLVGAGCVKQKSAGKVIQLITEMGTVSIVSTDVSPAPSFVKKIAAHLGCGVFKLKKSMSKEKKRMIGKNIMNPHIRDAYAAAVRAYRNYSNRLKRLETTHPENTEYYKHLLLRGYPVGKLK